MESSRNCLKSLKDALLEYAVINVYFLSTEFEAISIFPRNLFDEILEKSKDMCWQIRTFRLITKRDKLKWSDTSFFRNFDEFLMWDSKVLASIHDLKIFKLTLSLKMLTDVNIFREISQTADTLEDLDLEIYIGDKFIKYFTIDSGSAYSEEIKTKIGTFRPLKLKRLRLNVEFFELFPYTLDSDKLTVFDLCYCNLTKTFLQMLAGFKRLVHLSLYDSQIKDVSMGEVIDAVTTLKDMRFLNLYIIGEYMNELMLNKIMKNMEKLDILELYCISLNHPSRLVTPNRKLKALNYDLLFPNNINGMSVFTGLAHRIGNYGTLEGLMTIISTTPTKELYSVALSRLFDLIGNKSLDYEVLIEAEKKGIFNFRSPLRLDETFQSKRRSSSSIDLMNRMAYYYVSRYAFINTIEDFVGLFKDTELAKRFSRVFKN